MADLKKELIELICQKSYREGKFKLASGKESNFYIDLKPTTLHPKGAELIGKLSIPLLTQTFPVIHAVGGLTLGADPIATAISLEAHKQGLFWPAFIVRKESKSHGTRRYIEGVENLKPGASCVVVEDVATTGQSSLFAVERLREVGFNPLVILCVVNREEGADTNVRQKMGIPLLSLIRRSELSSV